MAGIVLQELDLTKICDARVTCDGHEIIGSVTADGRGAGHWISGSEKTVPQHELRLENREVRGLPWELPHPAVPFVLGQVTPT